MTKYTAEKARRLILAGGKVPADMEVGGSLYLSGTAITALPDNLTVGGYLDLRGTAITALPDNLTVGGYLYLSGTAITALPDNLTVGGSLDLSGTAITALPDNLTVGGSLYLSGTAITALPDNLTVGGSLYLRGACLLTFPTNWWAVTGEATKRRAIAADGSYVLQQTDTGQFTAGCRGPWTKKQALAHWGSSSRTDARAKLFVAALTALED